MMNRLKHFVYGCVLFAQCCLSVQAQQSQERVIVDEWEFNVAIGYAGISNPLIKRDAAETYVLPQWSYYGERFYIENATVGYAIFEDEKLFIDVFTYLNDDGIFYNADSHKLTFLDVRKFVPTRFPLTRIPPPIIERELSYMAGAKLVWDLDWFELTLNAAQDISAGHDGNEVMFTLADTVAWQNINLFLEAGVVVKSDKLVNYYYQFTVDEIFSRKVELLTDKWLANPFAKIALTYRLSEDWSAVLSISKHWLHRDIAASPLVESNHYISGFAGVNYRF